MRFRTCCARWRGCSHGMWPGGRRALRRMGDRARSPRSNPVDVRKLILLSLAVISLATAARVKPVEKSVVRRWLASTTLKQKVAQLVMIPFYGEAPHTPSKQDRH